MSLRRALLATICGLGLTGCMTGGTAMQEGLPTGVALEEFAPSFPLGTTERTTTVSASPTVVRNRLAAFGTNCLNGRTSVTMRRRKVGLPVGGRMTQTYRTAITNEDGTTRFIVAQQVGGSVLTTEAGRRSNVQLSTRILSDGQGGTVLQTVANRTFSDIIKASTAWANGSSQSCPGIFG